MKAKKYYVERAHLLFENSNEFRAFLLQQAPDQIVGFAKDPCNCPLASFAKSRQIPVVNLTFGHLDISVSGKRFAVVGVNEHGYVEEGTLDLEDAYWFFDFVNLVDRLHSKGEPISAARALLLLDTLLTTDIHPDELTEADLCRERYEQAKVLRLTESNPHTSTGECLLSPHIRYGIIFEGHGYIDHKINWNGLEPEGLVGQTVRVVITPGEYRVEKVPS